MATSQLKGKRKDAYLELVQKFPLVSIESDEQLKEAQEVLDRLLRLDLDEGEEAYVDALSDLIEVYEGERFEFPQLSSAEMLEHLIEAKGVRQIDVSEATGIPRSVISEILSGKRQVNLQQVGRFANYFHVPPSVFFNRSRTGQKSRKRD